ncbi:citrate lyase acyl carrier protein [Serratia sp. OLHL2]|uniref:Citrate lyase acyl carrier protein n=1 Tax=Serratia ureilytica TaxID=300181 RepID=A0A9X9C1I5_9GAMM|nr:MULTISPECIES: citrate lyase acyl carrier protein [Serratia]KAB5499139.1 citrate lyase acyl carrier protein [Enterobacter sp. RJAL6]KLE39463.1 citrate lyase subunit gamma [Serratia sp. TEL]MBM1297293.1 citrate lyase acyl carrier protein [Serratia nematodiphila]WIF08903.1 citrate lyase acyl carrier protein [Serratia sp. B1]ALD46152.1 citrate lyase subunit gamma [Serratia marcescens]
MKIIREAMAGTLESSDVMVRIAPAEGPQHDLLIASSVEKQFGAAIRRTLLEVLQRYEVEPVQVIVDDKGALDCVLRARLETALMRACESGQLPWEAKDENAE